MEAQTIRTHGRLTFSEFLDIIAAGAVLDLAV